MRENNFRGEMPERDNTTFEIGDEVSLNEDGEIFFRILGYSDQEA